MKWNNWIRISKMLLSKQTTYTFTHSWPLVTHSQLECTCFPRYSRGLRSWKISNREYQNWHFKLKPCYFILKIAYFPHYSQFLSPWIVKISNTKTANSKGCLFLQLRSFRFQKWIKRIYKSLRLSEDRVLETNLYLKEILS